LIYQLPRLLPVGSALRGLVGPWLMLAAAVSPGVLTAGLRVDAVLRLVWRPAWFADHWPAPFGEGPPSVLAAVGVKHRRPVLLGRLVDAPRVHLLLVGVLEHGAHVDGRARVGSGGCCCVRSRRGGDLAAVLAHRGHV